MECGEGEVRGGRDEEVEGWFIGWGVDGAEMRGEGGGFDEAAEVGEVGGCLCRRVMVILVVSDLGVDGSGGVRKLVYLEFFIRLGLKKLLRA